MKSLQRRINEAIQINESKFESPELQIDESVQSVIADITADFSPEQIKYIATAIMTSLAVGGAISYEKVIQTLKKSGKLKDDQIEKLEDVKKK
jgi:hypothetical protein